jgi:hypothetical protein
MINAEAVIYRALVRLGLHLAIVGLLRSPKIWRLSGITFPTALFATTGSLGSAESYIHEMGVRWERFGQFVPDRARALDFGTGLGGNLLGLRAKLSEGVGLDINPFFIGHAARIARRAKATHLHFVAYDGHRFPQLGSFDLAISTGAFERIPKAAATDYVHQLVGAVRPGGYLILYFLTTAAKERGFGRLLGAEAYVYWDKTELREMFEANHLSVEHVEQGFPTAGDTYVLLVPG